MLTWVLTAMLAQAADEVPGSGWSEIVPVGGAVVVMGTILAGLARVLFLRGSVEATQSSEWEKIVATQAKMIAERDATIVRLEAKIEAERLLFEARLKGQEPA